MEEYQGMNYYYLNRENAWLDFRSAGLDLRPDGAWQLAALPRLAEELPDGLERAPAPARPAGLAADPCGAVYYSHPQAARLEEIEPCEGRASPAICLPGEGSLPSWLSRPRGLLYHPIRRALFVADSGNSRIQVFDPRTWQVAEIWGHAGSPGAAPWGLHAPWSLAADPQGNVYVVDVLNRGESRVLKFDLLGRSRTAFWEVANQTAGFQRPVGVAVGTFRGQAHVFVLDVALKAVVVLNVDGQCVSRFGQGQLVQPLAIATIDGTVYVGDNALRQVLVFKLANPKWEEMSFVGPSFGYTGPVAALAPGAHGELWLHPGGSSAPLRLDASGAYARTGVLWGGPFGTGLRSVRWHRMKAILAGLDEGAHAQFFVYGSDDPTQLPQPPDPGSEVPFHGSDWRALPLDVADGLVPPPQRANRARASDTLTFPPDRALLARELNALPKETYLWVGAHLTGEGLSSPVLGQIWLNYDHATYRQYLPAIFSREREQADLLDRLLSLLESFFDEAEGHIRSLDRLFDPQAAPAGWLAWLAGWVGLELDESWPEDFQRYAIQQALESYTRRGTAGGLREALRAFVGIDARIEEPVLGSDWWALAPPGEGDAAGSSVSLLGFTTRLAPDQAEGAVLGGSASLDRSSLIGADDYGAPLFEAMAHQFTVQVYRGQVRTDGDLERLQAVVEREKPAHTAYHLCVIEPRMRVGFQARLGIDTLVAGPLPPTALDAASTGEGLVLGGDTPGRVGSDSRVGRTTRLTTGSLK